MKHLTTLVFILSLSSITLASTDSHVRGLRPQALIQNELPPTLTPGIFQQDIDHSGALAGQKFSQRYWIENSFATSSQAPIIYHICGEADCSEDYFLNDNARAWAKTLGARIVYLEHRYYGQSLPFSDLSTEHLQYLTLNNVIEDLATFQKAIAQENGWTGPWVSVGGSYSGTISALYRFLHPELVIGALASSAPMISGVGSAIGDQSVVSEISSTNPLDNPGERQWTYQACTTFGFWQAEGANFGAPLDLPSPELCQQVFAGSPQVNFQQYNQNFELPFISSAPAAPTHILFTYGSEDVWTEIGLSQNNNNNAGITIETIEGAVHHYDLNAPTSDDSQAVIKARNDFVNLVREWLGS